MSFSVPKTIGEYLKHFADELGDRVVDQFPPLHKPGDAASPLLRKLKRQPFPGQQLAVMGILKKWKESRAVAAIVISSKSWPNRPHLWFISLRPNYGLTSTDTNWIQQTAGVKRTVRVHSEALPQSLAAKGRC